MKIDERMTPRERLLLFQTLELLRKEIQPRFSDWKAADDWLFSQLDFTKAELAQIYEGRGVMYYDGSAVDFEKAKSSSERATKNYDDAIKVAASRYFNCWLYCLSENECVNFAEKAVSTIRGIGVDMGSGYYGLQAFRVNGVMFNHYCEVCKMADEASGREYYSVYHAVEFDEGDTLFSDWAHTETLSSKELANVLFELAQVDYTVDVKSVLNNEQTALRSKDECSSLDDVIGSCEEMSKKSDVRSTMDGLPDIDER